MNHFNVIKFVNLLGGFIFIVVTAVLIAASILVNSIVDELKQASNFSLILLILSTVTSAVSALVFIFGSVTEFKRSNGSRNSVIAETLYILGLLGDGDDGRKELGSGFGSVLSVSSVASFESIFGLGYDEGLKWTFSGRKPFPKHDPLRKEIP